MNQAGGSSNNARGNNARGGGGEAGRGRRRNRGRGNEDKKNNVTHPDVDPYDDLLVGALSRNNTPVRGQGGKGVVRNNRQAGQNIARSGQARGASNNTHPIIRNIGRNVPNMRNEPNIRNEPRRQNNHLDKRIDLNQFSSILNLNNSTNASQSNNRNNYQNRGEAPNQRKGFTIGFKFLEQIIEKPPAEVMLIFNEKKTDFNQFFNSPMRPDLVVSSVKLFTKICEPGFDNSKGIILTSVCNSIFFANTLKQYVMDLLLLDMARRDVHKFYFQDVNLFWRSIITLFDTIINIIPHTACDKLYEIIKACKLVIEMKEKDHGMEEDIKSDFENLFTKFNLCYEERENKKKAEPVKVFNEVYGEPPDDFRTISVYPKPLDILHNERVFLRPNITHGAYDSVDHYLDVQFRLLREDFICPLREGISIINNTYDNKRRPNLGVRIYPKTKFVSSYITPTVVGVLLDFYADKRLPDGKLKKMRKANWERSKRFMFGSLLCFTADKFKTVLFGTVAERKIELLQDGYIVVKISAEYAAQESELYDQEFVMIENEVYFEPYYHVLNALQKMNEDNFPMADYIVNVQAESRAPRYVNEVAVYNYKGLQIPLMYLRQWPTANQLKLNDSQYRAFQLALTRQFAIIQGPPGTGKTYLGLEIASTLLINLPKQKMLVVCYTNHALDQFLEGLMHVTNKIIRVGNRSKNEKLEQFNLSKLRGRQHRGFAELKMEINNIVKTLQGKLKDEEMLTANEGIIDLTQTDVIPEFKKAEWFPKCSDEHFSRFVYWLLDFASHNNSHSFDLRGNQPKGKSTRIDFDLDSDIGACTDELEYFEEDDRYTQQPEQDLIYDDISRISSNLKYNVTENGLNLVIEAFGKELTTLNKSYNETGSVKFYQEMISKGNEMSIYMQVNDKLKKFLTLLKENKIRNINNAQNIINRKGCLCTKEEKWSIYLYCLNILKENVKLEIAQLRAKYRELYKQFEEQRDLNDLGVLDRAQVIGMTTTSAARMQSVLQHLKIPIVIIEEAAEVPESHIIVSLSMHCEHLILIGDHQQLKPSTAVYKLAKKYKLDVSLFERMLNNGMHCARLDVQHRMRPEICSLISPNIYENLENHQSVKEFPEVLGMKKSLFFITHNVFEDNSNDEDTMTKSNAHEAAFLIRLCRYLILQGYEQEKITILTTYTGQMFLIKSLIKDNRILKAVKVTPVDNFQGEENDIILLSLVRSNKDANIGFLKTENRVCVALSRAKIGLYIIGNIDNLIASSEIWPKINSSLQKMDAIGTDLILQCQLHPDSETVITKAEDFDNSPEGGCNRLCSSLLLCGHYCKSICHITDRAHLNYNCKEHCTKTCSKMDHLCTKLCYQPCGDCTVMVKKTLKCGHAHQIACSMSRRLFQCSILVKTILPDCTHEVMKPCHADPEKFPCSFPCENRLNCGHKCEKNCHVLDDPDHIDYKCHKPCARLYKGCTQDHACKKLCFEDCPPCSIKTKKKYKNCSHYQEVGCAYDAETIKCVKPCRRTLPCGHYCKAKCSDPCSSCEVKTEKIIPECGHKITTNCSKEVFRTDCNEKCERKLPCGHNCQEFCKNECTRKCSVLVKNVRIISGCGHPAYIPCYAPKLGLGYMISNDYMNNCKKECDALLKCGHKCPGTCAECFQGRIHMPCKEPCGNTLVCQHSCKVPCREYCPPCAEPCKYRCVHSKCSAKCGQACVSCKEKCTWKCAHKECTKTCGQICDRDACNEPCLEKLKCGHSCIGLCGEKCPQLCRICDKEEVTMIFFGNEDEPDARFVMLEECRHIFEASGLDEWFSINNTEEISPKHCPKCKTTINSTPRYATSCKLAYQNIMQVKLKVFGTRKENEEDREILEKNIEELIKDSKEDFIVPGSWNRIIDYLKQKTTKKHKGKLQILSKIEFQSLDRVCKIMFKILKLHKSVTTDQTSLNVIQKLLDYTKVILHSFTKVNYNLTEQFLDDINLELSRLHWIVELLKIENSVQYKINKTVHIVQKSFKECEISIMCFERFTEKISDVVRYKLNNLLKTVKSSAVITTEDKKMIIQAMDFAKSGHWYKCPNGHIYCITECGGAMEESNCPECGARIGGGSHRLRNDNQIATEMDGATRPAYSENDFVYIPEDFDD